MTAWLGGFTFYSAFVVSILHQEMGSFASGLITQRVTNDLNLVGAIALVPWWVEGWIDRRRGSLPARGLRWFLLATTTLGLAWLCLLHRSMDRILESEVIAGFYPLHRVYLIVSTVMWVVNIALVTQEALEPAGRAAGTGSEFQ